MRLGSVISAVLSPSSPINVVAIACDVIALGALIAAALSAPIAVTITLGLVSIALMPVALRLDEPAAQSSNRARGRFIVSRIALVASTTAVAQGSTASVPWLFWVSLSIIGLVTIGEPSLYVLQNHAAPYAANVPGVRAANRARVSSSPLLVVTVAAIGASFLTVTVGARIVPVAGVLAVVALVWSAAVALDAAQRIRLRQQFSLALPRIVAGMEPGFVLHWDAPPDTSYQVAMWLPELERIGLPYFVLVRSARCFNEVAALTQRPIIMRKRLEDVDACITPSLRTVFYVNNSVRNAHLIRLPQLTHVQLNHGDSDKAPSFNPAFRMYDYDFVAGQAAIDRFAANGVSMPAEMFRIVGRPQVRGIEVAARPIADLPHPTVLYAPTWEGFNDDSRYSSLPVSEPLVRELLNRHCTVIFRPHPYSYRSSAFARHCRRVHDLLAADSATSKRPHLFGMTAEKDMSLIECFNAADALISDVSSVVVDFLYSEKPLSMVSMTAAAADFREQFPASRASYVLEVRDGGIADIAGHLDALLTDDELPEIRQSLKGYYLGDIPEEEYFDRFAAEARAVVGHAVAPATDSVGRVSENRTGHQT